jgi:hypothetical protein
VNKVAALPARAPAEDDSVHQPAPQGPMERGSEQRAAEPRRAATASWQSLAREGKYSAALEVVRAAGVDKVLPQLSSPDLILLGNAARFSHDVGTAERAYLAARGSGSTSSLAAYYLSRTASDERNNPAEAIRWLRTFLAEDSEGELAPSARARLMSLLERAGDRAGASRVAKDYLRLHPGGPHVGLARSLVGGARP